MTIGTRVGTELANAMRARDAAKLSALRMLKAALMNKEVEVSRALNDAEEVQVVQALRKQRHDSIEQFTRAGRNDLVDKERAELLVLEAFLPPPLEEGALSAIVDRAIAETGASSAKDMGKVMKAVMAAVAGQAVDGKRVNELVRSKLAAG